MEVSQKCFDLSASVKTLMEFNEQRGGTSGCLLKNKYSPGMKAMEGRVCGEMTSMRAKSKVTN